MPPYAGSSDRELSFAIGCRIVQSRFPSFASRDVNCMQSCPARASLTPLAPVVYKECAFCNHIFGR